MSVGPFDRVELARVLVQALDELGCPNAARTLAAEANVVPEDARLAELRDAAQCGDFARAEAALDAAAASGALQGRTATQQDIYTTLRMRLREQQYLELLVQRDLPGALACLRTRIAPLGGDPARLQALGALIVRPPADDGAGRHRLVHDMEAMLAPAVMLPSGRLLHLLEQAVAYQRLQDPYGGCAGAPAALLEDHGSDSAAFPRHSAFVLNHPDHVWVLRYSRDGQFLAAGCRDGGVVIWRTSDYCALHRLAHADGVTSLDWSPDNRTLLVAAGTCVTIWLLDEGRGTSHVAHSQVVTGVRWVTADTFVSGGMDRRFCVWRDGSVETGFDVGKRVLALDAAPGSVVLLGTPGITLTRPHGRGSQHVNSILRSFLARAGGQSEESVGPLPGIDGSMLDALLSPDEDEWADEKAAPRTDEYESLMVYDMAQKMVVNSAEIRGSTSHVALAHGHEALVNCRGGSVQLWDTRTCQLVRSFDGQRADENVIRASFGAQFVLCGSEDGDVYVWQRATGRLVERLHGHASVVSDVAWQPGAVPTIASCSDDGTVRIWRSTDDAVIRHADCGTLHAAPAGSLGGTPMHAYLHVTARPLPWM